MEWDFGEAMEWDLLGDLGADAWDMSEFTFDPGDFGDGVLDFDPGEWGVEDIGMDSDVFDFSFDDVGSGSWEEMSFDPVSDFAADKGSFLDGISVKDALGGFMSSGVSGAVNTVKSLAGSSGAKSVANTASNVAKQVGTKAASNLAKQAISKATSPGGKQTGAGTQKPSTGLGGLGESFKLPLSTKLGGYQAAAPTAKFPPKPGQASRAGVEAAKIQGRGQLDQTRRWLQQVAMSDTYSTSYTPSLSKRYNLA